MQKHYLPRRSILGEMWLYFFRVGISFCSFFTNIRSLTWNQDDPNYIIDNSNADISVRTGTWLSSQISDAEIVGTNKRFTIYRSDRDARKGDGIVVAIVNQIGYIYFSVESDLMLFLFIFELQEMYFRSPLPFSFQ